MDALNAADWVIVTVVGSSMLISLLRGFVREAFSLAGWVLGFIVAMVFSDRLAYLLAGFVDDETGRHILAFALLMMPRRRTQILWLLLPAAASLGLIWIGGAA